jgi:hypothetical protein
MIDHAKELELPGVIEANYVRATVFNTIREIARVVQNDDTDSGIFELADGDTLNAHFIGKPESSSYFVHIGLNSEVPEELRIDKDKVKEQLASFLVTVAEKANAIINPPLPGVEEEEVGEPVIDVPGTSTNPSAVVDPAESATEEEVVTADGASSTTKKKNGSV